MPAPQLQSYDARMRQATVCLGLVLAGGCAASPERRPHPAALAALPKPVAPTAPSAHPLDFEVRRELVQKVVSQYRRLGFEIDVGELNIVMVDERRARDDLAAMGQALSAPGQTEGLSVIMRMAGRAEGRDRGSLQELALRHLSEQTLAYYDVRSRTLAFRDVPLARVLGLEPLVRHELAHAYQDQRLGGVTFAHRCEHPTLDCYKAAHLVTEGHAQLMASAVSLAEQNTTLSQLDPSLMDDEAGARPIGAEAADGAYAVGYRFALATWNAGGGWRALEESFVHPPSSTEQLLHPEKDGRDLPRDVSLPGLPTLLRSARVVLDTSVGEYLVYVELLPEARSPDEAFLAASGWDGDRLRVIQLPDGNYAAEWRLLWDRAVDAAQVTSVLGRWTTASPRTRVFRKGARVDVVYAESEAVGAALKASLAASVTTDAPDAEDAASTAAVETRRIDARMRLQE
jgi:hypothetical protein